MSMSSLCVNIIHVCNYMCIRRIVQTMSGALMSDHSHYRQSPVVVQGGVSTVANEHGSALNAYCMHSKKFRDAGQRYDSYLRSPCPAWKQNTHGFPAQPSQLWGTWYPLSWKIQPCPGRHSRRIHRQLPTFRALFESSWMQLGTCCHDLKSKQVGDPFAQFKPYSDVKQAMQVVVHTYFKQRKENETSQM